METSTVIWLLAAGGVIFFLFQPFTVIGWFKGHPSTWPDKPAQPVQSEPLPPILQKDRQYQAKLHREWDYEFAALQINARKGTN